MIEDTAISTREKPFQTKSKKKRFAVVAMLIVAALGTRQLNHHAATGLASDVDQTRATADVDAASEISGPNSLFGEACLDKNIESPISNAIGVNDIELASSVDLAGSDRTSN